MCALHSFNKATPQECLLSSSSLLQSGGVVVVTDSEGCHSCQTQPIATLTTVIMIPVIQIINMVPKHIL